MVETVIPVVVAAWGVPVVSVATPRVSVIAEAVVAAPAVTTVTVPKPGVEPEAAVFVTATLPTVTEEHVDPQTIEQEPLQAAAPLLAK